MMSTDSILRSMKQLGTKPFVDDESYPLRERQKNGKKDKTGAVIENFPSDLQVRLCPAERVGVKRHILTCGNIVLSGLRIAGRPRLKCPGPKGARCASAPCAGRSWAFVNYLPSFLGFVEDPAQSEQRVLRIRARARKLHRVDVVGLWCPRALPMGVHERRDFPEQFGVLEPSRNISVEPDNASQRPMTSWKRIFAPR